MPGAANESKIVVIQRASQTIQFYKENIEVLQAKIDSLKKDLETLTQQNEQLKCKEGLVISSGRSGSPNSTDRNIVESIDIEGKQGDSVTSPSQPSGVISTPSPNQTDRSPLNTSPVPPFSSLRNPQSSMWPAQGNRHSNNSTPHHMSSITRQQPTERSPLQYIINGRTSPYHEEHNYYSPPVHHHYYENHNRHQSSPSNSSVSSHPSSLSNLLNHNPHPRVTLPSFSEFTKLTSMDECDTSVPPRTYEIYNLKPNNYSYHNFNYDPT
eukprot:TRINITY_DN3815_c0_g1_i3.p1 TRINITY_DN3815_c0_g1~~TRINITY_DN3815_c0_g1_i3.p1  ORF type:complete len:268 (-),score=27.85 TRINITY_DN3815_c0_g1_i3:197-1000(-)